MTLWVDPATSTESLFVWTLEWQKVAIRASVALALCMIVFMLHLQSWRLLRQPRAAERPSPVRDRIEHLIRSNSRSGAKQLACLMTAWSLISIPVGAAMLVHAFQTGCANLPFTSFLIGAMFVVILPGVGILGMAGSLHGRYSQTRVGEITLDLIAPPYDADGTLRGCVYFATPLGERMNPAMYTLQVSVQLRRMTTEESGNPDTKISEIAIAEARLARGTTLMIFGAFVPRENLKHARFKLRWEVTAKVEETEVEFVLPSQ